MTDTDAPRPVKPPQSRDGKGVSAVYREPAAAWGAGHGQVYVKRQDAYWCRPIWRLFRKTPTLRRELRGLDACRRIGIRVPAVITYSERGSQAELVLAEIADALPLDQALDRADADRAAILGNVAGALGRLHRAGWSHGALYPAHILVSTGPDPVVSLIDLEKARHSRRRRRDDLDRFWRHAPRLSEAEQRSLTERYESVRHGR